MTECCDVLCHNYVDPASIYRILPHIRPDPDLNRIQIHWIRPDPTQIPDPSNSPDIRPDPDLDLMHPYISEPLETPKADYLYFIGQTTNVLVLQLWLESD